MRPHRLRWADGSFVPIGEILTGDLVMSYNERDSVVEMRSVTAVHAPSPPCSCVYLQRGAHIYGDTAAQARNNSRLARRGRARAWRRAPRPSVNRTRWRRWRSSRSRSSHRAGLVYDLSVEATHTYFAGGVLAHNKLY
jgi:hypothetical protein